MARLVGVAPTVGSRDVGSKWNTSEEGDFLTVGQILGHAGIHSRPSLDGAIAGDVDGRFAQGLSDGSAAQYSGREASWLRGGKW